MKRIAATLAAVALFGVGLPAALTGCRTAAADDEPPAETTMQWPGTPHRVEPQGEPVPIADRDDPELAEDIPWPLELDALTACSVEEAREVLRREVECTMGNAPFEGADDTHIRHARAAVVFGEGREAKRLTYETGCETAPKVVQVEVLACTPQDGEGVA